MKKIKVEKSTYLDSISLMGISKTIGEMAGVKVALVAMATDTNLLLLKESGFDPGEVGTASANDLVIAVEARDRASLEAAFEMAERTVRGGTPPGGARATAPSGRAGAAPETAGISGLEAAVSLRPEINLVLISVPGRFAAFEARRALRAGKHVMIFSDNVSIEDERALKGLAASKGLLLMGPDCGTAIINGVGLGFVNNVPRGPVGIVAASGTGAQEVSSILARIGVGISHIIGTGGRDVSDAVGGAMTLAGLRALVRDTATRVLVVISKLPSPAVAHEIVGAAAASDKPSIIYFAGSGGTARRDGVVFARTLTDTAMAAATACGASPRRLLCEGADADGRLAAAARALPRSRKYLRGLFTGGTLAQEAVSLFAPRLGAVATNMKLPNTELLTDPAVSKGHTVVDLGDDAFTRGRAHPMIDQSLRLVRLAREMCDPGVGVVLLDIVLGYGCNPDPAGEIARTLEAAPAASAAHSRPAVIASICGTAGDPQSYDRQRHTLETAGVMVAETNATACEWVVGLLGRRRDER